MTTPAETPPRPGIPTLSLDDALRLARCQFCHATEGAHVILARTPRQDKMRKMVVCPECVTTAPAHIVVLDVIPGGLIPEPAEPQLPSNVIPLRRWQPVSGDAA